MKQSILCLVIATSLMSGASACEDVSTLVRYDDVKEALLAGKQVSVLMDFAQCTDDANRDKSGPKLKGGYRINSFLIPDDAYIAFSDAHETLNKDEKPKTEFIRYRLTADNKLTIRTFSITGDVVTPRARFTCHLNAGARFVVSPGA